MPSQAGIKIAGRNINNLRYADDTNLRAESKEELNSLLMRVEEESEKGISILNTHWKDYYLKWSFNTFATWCKELTQWKRPRCWERLKAGGEADNRGWDGWMASLTRWTRVWASSGSWWWTRKPGVLQSMGSQKVGHDWATEQRYLSKTGRKKKDALEETLWLVKVRKCWK